MCMYIYIYTHTHTHTKQLAKWNSAIYIYTYNITLLRTLISHEDSSRISNLFSGCSKNCQFVFGRLHYLIMISFFGNDKFCKFEV
jgi:hypothetical protein